MARAALLVLGVVGELIGINRRRLLRLQLECPTLGGFDASSLSIYGGATHEMMF